MTMYICIEPFTLNVFDELEEIIDGEFIQVEKDSEWWVDEEDETGEVKLERYTEVSYQWIEISKETLKKKFKEAKT